MASESGELVTFDELVEPNFGDDPDHDNGTGGPRTGPVGERVLAAGVPQRERVIHRIHQQWSAGADSNTAICRIYEVYGTNSKVSHVLKEMAVHKANGGRSLLRGR